MHSFTFAALVALSASLVSSTPTPVQVEVRQDETFPYPIVATYEAVMREVDPTYQAYLEESVVIRLNEPYDGTKRSIEERQTGTCDIQGCVHLYFPLPPPFPPSILLLFLFSRKRLTKTRAVLPL